MVAEKFQIYSVKLLQINLWVKNLNLFVFPHALKEKLSFRSFSLSPRQMWITHSTWTAFSEDNWPKKMIKINKGIGHKFW